MMLKNPGADPKPLHKKKEVIPASEYRKRYAQKAVKRSKLNNVRQSYNGYNYDSKLEADHARHLDWMIKAGEVKKWERQHKISLDMNGIHLANYFIDFKVWMKDGSIEYHEVKGMETMLWRLKWRLTRALYPHYKLVLLK